MMDKMLKKIATKVLSNKYEPIREEIENFEGDEAVTEVKGFFKEVDERLSAFGSFEPEAIGMPSIEKQIEKIEKIENDESLTPEERKEEALKIMDEFVGDFDGS